MWCLVWDNILGFSGMFKDSHVWLQITLENQMLENLDSLFNPLSVGIWIPFKTSEYLDFQA